MMYDLELSRVIARIKEKRHKTVLIQLPDGLKPKAKEIVDSIRKETSAEVLIWMGSCYGGCDVPQGLKQLGVDFLVQWGHNQYLKENGWNGEE
ncbi:diphthamide synthesis protein [Candidatus Woesearchaeota archaeon]|nr:diphthamide synthesis protein [Candidatus Woesearchaeota archaeon]